MLFLFLVLNANAFSQNITADALRRSYQQVNSDSATCARLYKKVSTSTDPDNTIIAYRGAITAAMANFSTSKKEKLNLFNSGKKLLEQSIAADSSNIETRFLRFSIQSNCPKLLNYNKNMKADKAFMIKNYPALTTLAVKQMISAFAQQSSAFTESEKQKLK